MRTSIDVNGLTLKTGRMKLKPVVFKMLITSDDTGTTISLDDHNITITFNMPDSIVEAIYKERFK